MNLPIFLLAMAAMMAPGELPFFRLDYATARSPLRGLAALYQLTPLKRRCLTVCRAAMIVVLLVVGMMNMWWLMIGLAVAVYVEKATRIGRIAPLAVGGIWAI